MLIMCPCRGSRVLSANVEVITILVNSKAFARACMVLELEQVRDWQSQQFQEIQSESPSPC